jgi:Ca2+-binding EF-hand superfamily protein
LEEVVNCFKRFGRSLERKRVTKMIREVDDNSDGKIDFEEFRNLMDLDTVSKG